MPTDNFSKLPTEKQTRIIEGALREFADNGFDAGSTNRIVKAVGISKGSLFNYFESKEDLWLSTAEYCLSRVIPIMRESMRELPVDILERVKALTVAVVDVYADNPLYYRFFMGVLDQGAKPLQQELLRRNAELFSFFDFFHGVDTSRLRIDEESTFLLVKWLFTGIKQEIFEQQAVRQDPEALRTELVPRVEKVLDALERGILENPK